MRMTLDLRRLLPIGVVLAMSWVGGATCSAQATRSDFVSDASFVVGTFVPKTTEQSPATRASAAQAFLKSLDASQRQLVSHSLDSRERSEWTNLPPRPDAGGLKLGDLKEPQLRAACDLMAAVLSEQGYQKMCNIMLADDQLLTGGQARPGFGTENFAFVIFGEPSASGPWGLQIDGHHIGVNLSFANDKVSMSPSFIGTQPEAFKIANKSYRPLVGEIDDAYQLVNSLSDEQRKAAVISPKRGAILAGPGADGKIPELKGVSCQTFSAEQKQSLLKLIGEWVNDLPKENANQEMERLASEVDQMYFSWNGALTPRSDISYTIQGPTLIIEYACQGNATAPLDHLHTMYRNPLDEYGGQLKK